jgi:hypothetical protein
LFLYDTETGEAFHVLSDGGPPVETNGGTDRVELSLKPTTVVNQDSFEFIEGIKAPIDKWGISELPEMLSWLEFGRIGRQETQTQARWTVHFGTNMPTRVVNQQQNALPVIQPYAGREFLQGHREGLDRDRRH